MSKPKLWIVRVAYEAYVLAHNETEALAEVDNIRKWESFNRVTATIAGDERLEGWDDDPDHCLVYGSDDDTTLTQARALVADA